MPAPTTAIYLNSQTPLAPAGFQNGKFASDGATPMQSVTVAVPSTGAVNQQTGAYTLQPSDCGKLVVLNSASAVTVTLPAAAPFAQWNCRVANTGTGSVTLSPGSLLLDGSTASLSLTQGQSCYLATDGTNYFTSKGLGSGSAYDIAIYIPGTFTASEVCVEVNVVRAFTLPSGLTGSIAKLDTAPTSSTTFAVNQITGGTTTAIGSVTFAAGSQTGTFTFSSSVTFAPGDVLAVIAPGSADATAAGLSVTFCGSR